jgi:phytoene desaturase
LFSSISSEIRSAFKHPKLRKLLEFPVLFLGARPENTPSLYSLMNYADLSLGTWYPQGGMHKIIEGMAAVATELGVKIRTNAEVTDYITRNSKADGVKLSSGEILNFDVIVGSADYHHLETKVLQPQHRSYSEKYWEKRVMAPSCLLYYVGVNKQLKGLLHHNLFFDEDFAVHAKEIYQSPQWPSKPLFYVSAPSVTDQTVAPAGYENLFLLIPVAPGLHDTPEIREQYFDVIIKRLETLTQQEIRSGIVYKRSYAHNDFVQDYHAFKGNAYGLANTLFQTAFLKPKLKSKKISNLYYAGQLTTPGPGMPPSIISGSVVAKLIAKEQSLKIS